MSYVMVMAAAVLLLTGAAGGWLVRRAMRPDPAKQELAAALALERSGRRDLLSGAQRELLRRHYTEKWAASGDPSDLEQALRELE